MRVVAKNYGELVDALNRQRQALGLTLCELDELAGLADRHSSKLLSKNPTKFIGGVSLACLLAALGLQIVIVDDVEGLARIRRRLQRQDTSIGGWMSRAAPAEPAERGAVTSAA